MADLSIPNNFLSGATISSAEVNANFDAIETMVNSTGVPKAQAGVIDATALATAAVTAVKIAAPGVGSVTSASTALSASTNTVLSAAGGSATEADTTTVDVDATTSRITAKRAGLYLLVQHLAITSLGAGATVSGGWAKNGAGVAYAMEVASAMSNVFTANHARLLSLSANDYIQGYARSGPSGSTASIITTLIYLGPAS